MGNFFLGKLRSAHTNTAFYDVKADQNHIVDALARCIEQVSTAKGYMPQLATMLSSEPLILFELDETFIKGGNIVDKSSTGYIDSDCILHSPSLLQQKLDGPPACASLSVEAKEMLRS